MRGSDEMTVEELLQQNEGKTLDFKRDLSGLDGIIKTVISFANTAGGDILVGVEDDGTVVGLDEDPVSYEETLSRAIQDKIKPPISADISFHTHEGKTLLLLKVPHVRQGPFHIESKGLEEGTFFRYGSTSSRAEPEVIRELERWRDALDYSQEPIPELDREALDLDRAQQLFDERRIDVDDVKYKSLNVLADHGEDLVPTNGGVILFGRDPQARFPDARFRCAAFDGTDKATFRVTKDIEGSLINALTEVPAFVDHVTLGTVVVEEMQNQAVSEYPALGIREALVNAIAHADYARRGTPLSLSVFDDRLEIINPGSLPFGMTIERLRQGESTIRNRALARVFNTLGYMEEWGSGYQRIIKACRDGGYPEPMWEDTGNIIRVTFYPHPRVRAQAESATQSANGERNGGKNGGLADRPSKEQRVEELLQAVREMDKPTAKDLRERTGITERTLDRYISELTADDKIERIGSRRDGYYVVREGS